MTRRRLARFWSRLALWGAGRDVAVGPLGLYLVGPPPCCDGSGYADFAAVPCPAPDCPAVREQLRRHERGR